MSLAHDTVHLNTKTKAKTKTKTKTSSKKKQRYLVSGGMCAQQQNKAKQKTFREIVIIDMNSIVSF